MKFCTVINCIDGRIQLPVIHHLQKRFNTKFVDNITEAGPNIILSEGRNEPIIKSILARIKISVERHESMGIGVVGHFDCAANPAPRDVQDEQIKKSIQFLKKKFPNLEMVPLWVDEDKRVHEFKI